MRQTFLSVRGDTFDVKTKRREIEEIAGHLGEYLDETGVGGRSKHRALGAVGKALQRARISRGDALLGYARRVHEQTASRRGTPSALQQLDQGLRKLDALLESVPHRAAREVLERVDYATYYDVRRRYVEFQQAWRTFAAEKRHISSEEVPWFSKDLADQDEWKDIRDQFLAQRRAPAVVDEAEED